MSLKMKTSWPAGHEVFKLVKRFGQYQFKAILAFNIEGLAGKFPVLI